jgi:HlyD family secretion protein
MKLPSLKVTGRSLAAAAVAIAVAIYFLTGKSANTTYVTEQITQGPIVRSVTATGTVNPVITVQVGSYVSGPIVALYADFNSPVKAGQLIAKIDPKPFEVKVAASQAAVANSRAQLGKDQADLAYKKITYERNARLAKEDVVSQDVADSALSAYHQAVAQVALDRANIQQQEANLRDAQVNLDYTNIVSPVDGTVVSRNVDVGQTVAASFQTPTLFLIAKDLTKMQVDSNVSESDIGNVRVGESAIFRVDAFPDRDFDGIVGQVRQAPITVQNVVTYDVVVNVTNPELLLKPGMTANVTVITARRDQATRVPLRAIRFSPRGAAADHAIRDGNANTRGARVWVSDGAGGIRPVSITTGLDDGTWVELLGGDLHPGDRVVTDEIREAAPSSSPKPGALRFPH